MTNIETQLRAPMTTEQQEIFDILLETSRKIVSNISASPPTTKDYYGDYLPYITTKIDLLVFIIAGAPREGVIAAAKINGII